MAAIPSNFGGGGRRLTPDGSGEDLATILRDIAGDLAEQRTQFIALLAKLDDDAGVTDVNYESTLTPAALETTAL